MPLSDWPVKGIEWRQSPAGVVQSPMTIPNVITIIRLFLVPLVVLMMVQGRMQAAFVLFLIAGISDAVDGAIARRFDMKSELGAYLDPLADKALIVSIYVTLGVTGVIPSWLTILVVARDIMIVSAVMISWIMDKPVEIAPIIVSKLNTGAQIGFAALILGANGFGYNTGPAFEVAQLVVATLTVASMGAYLALWFKHMAE
jgi:cardiolipin synthase (CMP-forming)